jgi:hypothetical protein
MAQVRVYSDLSNLEGDDFRRYSSALAAQIVQQMNGNLQFGANIASSGLLSVVFPDASTVMTVNHRLGRVPVGYLVVFLTGAATVYVPQGYNFTNTQIFLQSDSAVTAKLYII